MLLFARTRRWGALGMVVAVSATVVLLCGPFAIALNPTGEGLVRVALLVPLLPGVAIAAALATPLAAQERVASREIRAYRAAHVVLSTVLAAAVLAGAAVLLAPADGAAVAQQGPLSMVRNVLALTGAGVIGYRMLGSQLGWAVPVVWVILPPLLMPRPDQDRLQIFTLVNQPDGAITASAFACAVWIVAVWVTGALRDPAGR